MSIPIRATYRLQLSSEFTLDDARAIVPYLSRLGVSHVYASPVLRSRPGSTHGYDVVDPTRLDPELGSDESWSSLIAELRAHRMGLVLDIVPNHMGVGADNPFWDDLFANGPASRYASWFDIDWNAPARGLKGRVLIPILGDERQSVIARGEITIVLEHGRFRIRYFDHSFPIDPATLPRIIDPAMASLPRDADPADLTELARISTALAALPPRLTSRHLLVERRQRDAPELVRELEALLEHSPTIRALLESSARTLPSGEGGAERLTSLLDAQVYALEFWRRAAHEINYRRFFDINELVALRMEDPAVFGATHRRIIQWVKDGQLDGLRIDHVDGLRNPREYLERLNAAIQQVLPGAELPIYVEKILSAGERLRPEWPVAGTTGYEFLAQLDAIFVDPDGRREIERAYRAFLGIRRPELHFHEVAVRAKAFILRGSLAADVQRLVRFLVPIAHRDATAATLSRTHLSDGIVQLIACLPVYRTYIEAGGVALHEDDRDVLVRAFAAVREAALVRPPLLALFEFIFCGDVTRMSPDERAERDAFVVRFQQVSGPAAAKGVEDTALYRYSPLLSLNEVGSDPAADLSDALGRLHAANGERSSRWPATMLATSTHDTKRSADVRSRIDALSEIPREWAQQISRWHTAHRALRKRVDDKSAPDAQMEYVIYQTLVGIWPARHTDQAERITIRDRVQAFARKSAREAKGRTSWTDANEPYESAVSDFIAALLDRPKFLPELEAFVASISATGTWNAIARIVLHLTSPGVPDIYQGEELWTFSLVDPDNRGRVSYDSRESLLAELEAMSPIGDNSDSAVPALLDGPNNDSLKLAVIHRALRARAEHHELFARGGYEPLFAHGSHATRIFAFLRHLGSGDAAIIVVPRLTHSLAPNAPPIGEIWADTHLQLPARFAATRWRCALSGRALVLPQEREAPAIAISEIFDVAPFALLLPSSLRRDAE